MDDSQPPLPPHDYDHEPDHDPDPAAPLGNNPGSGSPFRPPVYLSRQAAQPQPLTPYHPYARIGVVSGGVALAIVLLVAIVVGVAGAAGMGGTPGTGGTGSQQPPAGPVIALATATQRTSQPSVTVPQTTATATATATPIPPIATPLPVPTATATPLPAPTPTPTPTPSPTPCASPCNPWGYNFTCCQYIYSPPANFCDYFACTKYFWKDTNGYVVECNDGNYSHSGGRSSACSYHGGVWRPLLQR